MNKLLIIANLYHASPRIPGLSTYLYDYNWEVTIVTPKIIDKESFGFPKDFLNIARIIETNYRGDIWQIWRNILKKFDYKIKRSGYQSGLISQVKGKFGITKKKSFIEIAMNLYRFLVFAFPDDEKPWENIAIKKSEELIKKEKYDAVFSTCPYLTSHLVASKLKKRHGIPWIADFRDPWSQNHDYPHGKIRKWLDTKIEKIIMSNVDLMIAATPEVAIKQTALHNKNTLTLTNGFNLENFQASLSNKFTIIYTGKIYQNKQNPENIFAALSKLIKKEEIDKEVIEINFYGALTPFLSALIDKYNLQDIVKEKGIITRQEALKKQRNAQLLLLLNWADDNENGIYPTKFFEYLAARRPILATGGYEGDDIKRMILKTNSGVYAMTNSEVENALLNFYKEFKINKQIHYKGNLKEINKYSYQCLSKQLSNIINKVL